MECKHCDKPSVRRGLCDAHYQSAWRRVRDGRVTWERIEGAGLGDPSSRSKSDLGKKLDALAEGTE